MLNQISAYPQINWNMVDVKDVARAHIRAMERPEAANKRFILSQEKAEQFLAMADKLAEALDEAGWDI